MKKRICLLLVLCITLIASSGCVSRTSVDKQLKIDDYLKDFTGSITKYIPSESIDVNVSFENATDERIKSIALRMTPYDIHGEPAGGTITVEFNISVEPDEKIDKLKKEDIWSGDNINYAVVTNVEIKYSGSVKDVSIETDIEFESDYIYETTEPAKTAENTNFYDYILILDGDTSRPNSAGGVDVTLEFSNCSDKTIKYATFTVVPYNAVDDPVACTITRESVARLKVTGPITPSDGLSDHLWKNVWYNYSIDYYVIKNIEIDFMDGETVSFDTNLPMPLF